MIKNKKKETHTHTSTTITNNKITVINNNWILISLNINGLDSSNKKQRLTEEIQKQNPSFCSIHFNINDRHYVSVKGWEKIFQENRHKTKAGVAIFNI